MSDNPINYNIGSGQPVGLEDFTQGAALGQGLRMGNEAALNAQQTRGLEAQKAAAQQAMMAELAAESRRPGGPNSENVAALMVRYPQMAENLKRSMDVLAPAEKRERLGQLSSIVAAAKSGNVNLAIDLLKRNATAYRNAGREKDAQAMDDNARLLEEAPEDTMFTLESALAANDPEKYMETVKGMGTLGSDVAKAASEAVKTEAEAKIKGADAETQLSENLARIGLVKEQINRLRVQSALEAKRLNLDEREFSNKVANQLRESGVKMAELSAANQKMVSEAAVGATAVKEQLAKVTDLAKGFREEGNALSGAGSYVTGAIGDLAGVTTDEQAKRKKYAGLVESLVSAQLKGQGATSEAERDAARKGYPSPNATPAAIADFLDKHGAEMERTLRAKQAEVDFISQNNGLGPARVPMTIRGVQVQQGERFDQFVDRLEGATAMAAGVPEARSLGLSE